MGENRKPEELSIMTNAEWMIEVMITKMRKGRDPYDILKDPEMVLALNNPNAGIRGEELVQIAQHVVYELYEGKFPVDWVRVGDIAFDPIGNIGVITNVDTAIHVLYLSGKTHKFQKYQGPKFRKTGKNILAELEYALTQADDKILNYELEQCGSLHDLNDDEKEAI